jgi:hypothetical protein
VTIAKRPFVWAGTATDMQVIWVKSEPEYFYGKDWTTQIRLNPKENFFSAVTPGTRRKSAVKGAD